MSPARQDRVKQWNALCTRPGNGGSAGLRNTSRLPFSTREILSECGHSLMRTSRNRTAEEKFSTSRFCLVRLPPLTALFFFVFHSLSAQHAYFNPASPVQVEEALMPVATAVAEAGKQSGQPDLIFFTAKSEANISSQVRHVCDLKRTSDAPQVCNQNCFPSLSNVLGLNTSS